MEGQQAVLQTQLEVEVVSLPTEVVEVELAEMMVGEQGRQEQVQARILLALMVLMGHLVQALRHLMPLEQEGGAVEEEMMTGQTLVQLMVVAGVQEAVMAVVVLAEGTVALMEELLVQVVEFIQPPHMVLEVILLTALEVEVEEEDQKESMLVVAVLWEPVAGVEEEVREEVL